MALNKDNPYAALAKTMAVNGMGRGRGSTMPAWMTSGVGLAGSGGAGAVSSMVEAADPGVLVSNLAAELTEAELRQFFGTCGNVTEISMEDGP
jgi:hypothetical protein